MLKIKQAWVVLLLAYMLAALVAACGGGNVTPVTAVNFTSGQAASAVIGQTSFTAGVANQASGVAANTSSGPYGNPNVYLGIMYLGDTGNNRTLVYSSIPVTNGVAASFAIGQNNLTSAAFGTSASAVFAPAQNVIYNNRLLVAEASNNRVSIYNTLPASSPGAIDVVVGQASKTTGGASCSATGLNQPKTLAMAGARLVVADAGNNRVLIWNSVPPSDAVAADVVLGQAGFTGCTANRGGAADATTLSFPTAVWSDGTRLAVADSSNNRVLIWRSIPTVSGQPADLVLGQTSFTGILANGGGPASAPTAATLWGPSGGVYFNSAQLIVADTRNNRVLLWNTFPSLNGQAADVVLGQASFTANALATSATGLFGPSGLFLYGNRLIVSDTGNNRYLIYSGR